jgi:DNA-binding transcriptional LysR family regulator
VVLDVTVDSPLVPPVEDFDLTILGSGRLYDANVVARPVIVSEGLLCASPRYLRAAGTPREPEDLHQHAMLRLSQPGIRQREWRLLHPEENDREVLVDAQPVFMANHSDTLLRATLDGTGISAQPLDLIANYLHEGQLRRVLSPWITGRFTLYAALPSRKYVPARARVFMEFLIEQTRLKAAEAARTWPARPTAGTQPVKPA